MALTRVCSVGDLEEAKSKRVLVDRKRGPFPIAVVRIGDEVFAAGDTCSHANYSLSEGEVYPDERTIECWKHGSTFSLVTGMAMCLPATKPVETFEVSIVEGDVFVEVGE